MERLLVRLVTTAIALFAAVWFVPGIELSGIAGASALPSSQAVLNLVLVAVIFGLVNAVVRPILKILAFPITCLTLGLFSFVINALMLLLTSFIAGQLDLGFVVTGLLPALIGAIVVSIASTVVSIVLPEPK
jgi:putative membrane protein